MFLLSYILDCLCLTEDDFCNMELKGVKLFYDY